MTEFIKWAQEQYDALEKERVNDPESLVISAAIISYAQVLKKAQELSSLLPKKLDTPVRYGLIEKEYIVDTEEAAQKLMRKELPSGMRPDYTIVKVIP